MGSSCHQRLDDRGCQLLGRRRRNAHANVAAELDLQRRRAGHRSLVRPRRDHHLSKSCRGGPQIAPPSINLPRNDIHAPGNIANRRAQCKSLRDDRPLLLRAPPPAPLRARQHLNSAHRTVSCTSASHSACTGANRRRISPARARRPLTDGYRRLWRLMASKTEERPQKEEMPEKEGPETAPDSPLLDLSDAAVKKLIHSAKKRGYVTHDQVKSVLPSDEVNSEQIEDVLAVFNKMGVNVVETEEASQEREEPREEADEEAESESGELVEVQQKVPVKSEAKEPTERTDDPVRMYLRTMGSIELLSRQGEIAIAKRIEAGREAMIAGLCESPLTLQAIIIWRDELNEGKVFLRDIIDLEATYAGPDAKAMPAPVIGPDGQPIVAAPAGATPFKPSPERASGEEGEGGETAPGEGDFDDDDMENSLSLAAIEAELKPKVVETFDNIADAYKRLRRLQDQDIQNKLRNDSLS